MNKKSIKSISKIGYAFDDVLLIPKKSTISTRKLIDTRTYFSKNIKLKKMQTYQYVPEDYIS